MAIDPLCVIAITGDLGIEDEKTGLEFGHLGTYSLTMVFEQFTALGFRFDPTLAQARITQHVPDRHSGCFQPTKKFNPDQNRRVVVTMARSVTLSKREQPDPFVIADRMS
jgi:hypothetical protein